MDEIRFSAVIGIVLKNPNGGITSSGWYSPPHRPQWTEVKFCLIYSEFNVWLYDTICEGRTLYDICPQPFFSCSQDSECSSFECQEDEMGSKFRLQNKSEFYGIKETKSRRNTLYSGFVKCWLFSDAFKPMHYEYYITTLSIVQWIAGEILTF